MSGATILGDGTVALILDVEEIVKSVEHEELCALGRAARGRREPHRFAVRGEFPPWRPGQY